MARNVFTRTLKSTVIKLTTRKKGEHILSTRTASVAGIFEDDSELFKAAKKAYTTDDEIVVDAEPIGIERKRYTMSVTKFITNADKVEDVDENEPDTEDEDN